MSEDDGSLAPVLARLVKAIEDMETQVSQKKRLVNELCREYDLPARYAEVDSPKTASLGSLSRDQFYGRPLASVVREYLTMRGSSARGGLGAASVNEIYDALVTGGFKFETRDEANAKRGLRIALTKGSQAFHRVGSSYGLAEWYPSAAAKQQRAQEQARNGDEEVATAGVEEDPAGEVDNGAADDAVRAAG